MKTIARSSRAEVAIHRAEQLAREIDELLQVAAREEAASPLGTPYAIRVVQGVVRSLVDQLEELRPMSRDFLASTHPAAVATAVDETKIHAA
jgi:hypothetical protein